MATKKLIRSLLGDISAATLVEATLMMPLLFSMALGTFEFGRALQHHHVINKGVRDAARYLTQVGVTCPPAMATGSVDNPNDITVARNLAMTGYESGGEPILNYWTDPSTVTITVNCINNLAEALRGRLWIPTITVSASVPYADIGFLNFFGVDSLELPASHQELHIGR